MNKLLKSKKKLSIDLENSNDNLKNVIRQSDKHDFGYHASQSIELYIFFHYKFKADVTV